MNNHLSKIKRYYMIFQTKIRIYGFVYIILAIINKYLLKPTFHYYISNVSKPNIIYPIPNNIRELSLFYEYSEFISRPIPAESKLPGLYSDQNEVVLTGFWGVPWLANGNIIIPHYSKYLGHISWGATYRILYLLAHHFNFDGNIESLQNGALFIPNPIHYGHWIVEDLIKLKALYDYYDNYKVFPNCIIPKNSPSWLIESLSAGGVPDENIIEYNHKLLNIDNYIHIYPGRADNKLYAKLNASAYQWVRDHYYEKLELESTRHRRIYLSKQSMGRRHVDNFEEISNILSKFDFEIVEPESLDFESTVKLISTAEIIVGPQGSNMHNVLFSDNAKILDLKPLDRNDIVTEFLTRSVGSTYYDMFGENKSNSNGSYSVNPSELEAKIKTIVQN